MNAPVKDRLSKLKAGDVLSYIPSEHHCREGTAIVNDKGVPLDTFWRSGDSMSHRLTEREFETAEVRFNVNDYEALDLYSNISRPAWETYHPDDRGRISSQHGLQEALFVRRGAEPDLATRIANARAALETAESGLRSAEWRLERCREDLAELEAQA